MDPEEDEEEEDVEPEEGDDPTSDLNSDHDEDQIAQYLVEGQCITFIHVMDLQLEFGNSNPTIM